MAFCRVVVVQDLASSVQLCGLDCSRSSPGVYLIGILLLATNTVCALPAALIIKDSVTSDFIEQLICGISIGSTAAIVNLLAFFFICRRSSHMYMYMRKEAFRRQLSAASLASPSSGAVAAAPRRSRRLRSESLAQMTRVEQLVKRSLAAAALPPLHL